MLEEATTMITDYWQPHTLTTMQRDDVRSATTMTTLATATSSAH